MMSAARRTYLLANSAVIVHPDGTGYVEHMARIGRDEIAVAPETEAALGEVAQATTGAQ